MKSLFFYSVIFAIILGFSGCEKNDTNTKSETIATTKTDNQQLKFAKILAPALADNYELRNLIKEEALKQFDKDYDVLYQLIRDKVVGNQTVSELLSSYAKSKEDFVALENSLPLLTILVPTVPNFSPETWNPQSETPKVAVELTNNGNIPLIDETGNETLIPEGQIPGFPVVVIKQNERIAVNQSSLKSFKTTTNGKFSFSYIDEAFDGTKPTSDSKLKRTTTSAGIDPACIEAYNLGMEWQRDYIYYGLTPTKTTGAYRHNYSEFITSFTMQGAWLGKISEQTGDPQPKGLIKKGESPWTDGFFEFVITIIINDKSGTGNTLTKMFSAQGSDLANLQYEVVSGTFGKYYRLIGGTIKTYNPNLEICPWDLQRYGNSWKFIISEKDATQETTTSYESSSSYSTNFGLDATGEKIKIGLKFGASATTTEKNTTTVKTYLDSDPLGEAILTFDQPIITGVSNGIYSTREITTGWVSLSIEPKKVF